MSSGDLSNNEKINLETRTAMFVCIAGVQIRCHFAPAAEKGVALHRLQKVLANAIWDWHWLSATKTPEFGFKGIGTLRWAPHRFGALGQVEVGVEYDPRRVRIFVGRFVFLPDVMKSCLYSLYGYQGRNPNGFLRFQPYISYPTLKKGPMEGHEIHYWQELCSRYAQLGDETLDALASCRQDGSSAECVLAQLAFWYKHTMGFLSAIVAGNGDPRPHMEVSRGCVRQIFKKLEYAKQRSRHLEDGAAVFAGSELERFLPLIGGGVAEDGLFERLRAEVPLVRALHRVCREVQKCVGLDVDSGRDLEELERRLVELISARPELEPLVRPANWLLLASGQQASRLASVARDVVSSASIAISKRLSVDVLSLDGFFGDFLDRRYPLPSRHFSRGN